VGTNTSNEICKTGSIGLDEILNGGLPKGRVFLLQGEPGTGKTTLAFQFLMEGAKLGETCLYVSFSEAQDELDAVAASHGWNLKNIHFVDLSAIEQLINPESQNTVFHPFEVEMNQTTDLLLTEVKKINPTRIVFDSVSEMRMMAETPLRYRKQMLALKQFFAAQNATVLLLDDLTSTPLDLQVRSIVHGAIALYKLHPEFGEERRRMTVIKLRGVKFSGGYHDYIIKKGGLQFFPRNSFENGDTVKIETGPVLSALPELDNLLGGGLDRGTSTLILGPAGTGKSTLSLQYAQAAAERGEHVAIYCFEESIATLLARTSALGMTLEKFMKQGKISIIKIDPAQLSPGEFSDLIRTTVSLHNTRMIVIDSLNGYIHAMPEEQFLTLQLHELFAYLGSRGIVTILVLAQQGIMGAAMTTPIDLTYLADTVLITRYFEAMGSVKKAISVLKKRAGYHESTIREFSLGNGGITVGEALTDFRGVLTGVPEFVGNSADILSEQNG
jgi:circadian clock protein KaiC